jgi:Flp pilus assembly protein TadG
MIRRNYKRQQGLASVEFAIVGLVSLVILFGTLEVARMMFTMNMLQEATRRAARMAAVCTVDNPGIARAALFNSSGSGTTSPFINGLTTANIQVDYLDAAGTPVVGYATDVAAYLAIDYVRVQIINFQHQLIVPGLNLSFITRPYPTIMPRESLGIAKSGQSSTCT